VLKQVFATVVLAAIAAACSPSPFEPPAVPSQEQLRWLTLPAPLPLPTPAFALMDQLSVRKASIVGWSDGGNIGLSIALRYPERLDRLFAFGANSDPSGVMPPDEKNPVFALLMPRLAEEYRRLSPTPDKFETFSAEIGQMWATQPRWSEADLARIRNPVAIADGDHEEMIFRSHTEQMTRQIPGAQLILLRDVSHFAPFQDPAQFNEAVHNFLEAP